MNIDWPHFTPATALAGGLLIGAAASLLVLARGRIAGISGIVAGLLHPQAGDVSWRIAFVAGLLAAPWLLPVAAPQIEAGPLRLIAAGLLVGLGTRYGAGCTSGHGVCGLSRRSPRSLVATLAFMAAGFAVVYVLRHLA